MTADPDPFAHVNVTWVRTNLARATDAVLADKPLRSGRVRYLLDTSPGSGNVVVLETGSRQVALGAADNAPAGLEEAANWFWCEDHVAMWVDVHIRSRSADEALITLLRSRAFVRPSARIMHRQEGYPPFHIPR